MDSKLTSSGKTDSNFRIIQMPPDGSCLFHAICYVVYGNTAFSHQVREKIVYYVLANWTKFQILTHDLNGDNYISPEHYCYDMLKPTTYGSACELIAAAELFHCVFRVYHNGHLLQSFGVEGTTTEYHLLFTGNLSSGHFDVLEATHKTKNDHNSLIKSNVALKSNHEKAPEMPPKLDRKMVSQCFETEAVNCKHNTEEPKAKRLKVKTTSQSVESSHEIDHNRDVLHEKKELLEHVNKKTNLQSQENFLENIKQPENTSEEDKGKSKKKRSKRKGRFSNMPRLKQMREAAAKYKMTHPEVNKAAVAKYTQQNPEVHQAAAAKYTKKNPDVNRAAVAKYDENHEKRQQRKNKMWTANANSGFHYDPNITYETNKVITIGPMNILCIYCNALKWKNESKGLCCGSGKVCINRIEKPPEPLHSLIVGDHPESEHFLINSRKYNSAFQMTSFGAKQIVESGFMPTFKVQGQVYHLIGSLIPSNIDDHQFLQLYFIGDDNKETFARCDKVPGIKPELVNIIQRMLHNCNTYVKDFKCAIENMQEDSRQFQVVIHADKKPTNAHRGRYNEPVSGEVGAVIVGQEFGKRDIIIKGKDNKLQRISETHRAYDALQYPLMFCYGEDGYSISIPQYDPVAKTHLQKTVSAASFYCFRLMVFSEEINYLHYFRGLLNQFMVDMYAKIETERLNFIRNNQKKLRAENYIHLKDAVGKGDTNPEDLGQAVILPSTFTGGARYMHERTQDAMTYVRHYGRPDLFITFTCNPKWEEINKHLFEGQKPQDRHDLISRVFHLKVKSMINLLTKVAIFGPSLCFMYTIEWQKRGLPHAHILLWLKNKIKPEQIDKVICAEIPDPKADPKLHNIVKSTMIHGPCGDLNRKSPCMVKGSCGKQYPRPLLKDTQTGDDGYPKYRRRASNDGGHTVKINNVTLDNRWVVPYNPVLSRTFNAHINVEYCNSVKSIKYVCKYVNKGSDQAVFSLSEQLDEVTRYESGRYISSSEAAWRIFCFPIHERIPPVFHLAVHLENGQRVYFTSTNVNDRVNNPTKTTLIGFFELCQHDDFAKCLLYCEVPSYYVWKSNRFERRKQGLPVQGHVGIKKDHVLGRVYTIHPNNFECYYLRVLLHEIRGPTSFEYIKTVRGVVHPTFKAACSALGLLENDSHWDHTLEEASLSDSPHKIRELLATMLVFCQVNSPMELWENHKESLADDIKRSVGKEFDCVEQVMDIVYNRCLVLLEDLVYSISGNSLEHYGLPSPSREHDAVTTNRELLRELNYDVAQLSAAVAVNAAKLNEGQNKVFNEITSSITSQSGQLYFLDAPGGTGKTFLINLLLAKVRSERKIAIAVASSGIAATLLDGGKTAHSAFKIPLNLNHIETPMCNISKQSSLAQVLRETHLIVWDECTMAHKGAIEALDRTLRDIRNCNCLMGGITVLLAGDFRQTLPVVPRGTRADEVKACLKSSYLWPKIKILTLRVNMRVYLKGDSKSEEFSALLLQIGDGNMLEDSDGKFVIPQSLCSVVHDLKSLLDKTYPDINCEESHSLTWLQERAILTPTNESASGINLSLLEQLTANMSKYKSVDSVVEAEDAVHYPVEFLHSLDPPGIPPHVLFLKVGAPIMLLRNLNPPKLCNGTRLQVKVLHKHVIEATIFTGVGKGETVFIPRIPMIPSDHPFQFKRLQFPVKVCYAMTINKAQGQSLKMAGVDLRNDCFSHGQLYVACSRVSSPDSLVILQPEEKTKNIVYQEVLRK